MHNQLFPIDITLALGHENATWPGDSPFSHTTEQTLPTGGKTSTLSMCAHSGTHIDTPAHVFDDGLTLGAYTPSDFILPAAVLDVPNAPAIGAEHITDALIQRGDAVLFRTRNTRDGIPQPVEFRTDFTALTPDAARKLIALGVRLVGVDGPSVDMYTEHSLPVHHALLAENIPLVENLNLFCAPEGRYTLCCLPLSMPDAEASPVRAILLPEGKLFSFP